MSTDAATPVPATTRLPEDVATCQQMLRELLATVAALRATVDQQQAHIEYLVRMTFGRRSERVEGPTLFDGLTDPQPEPAPAPAEAQTEEVVVRQQHRGHRRQRPGDLPRQHEVLDLTEAEKHCPCCGELRVRIGANVSERLDYRPA